MAVRNGRRHAGFTLIELLVVVLIIGVLAAIAVPQYLRVVEKGRVSEVTTYIDSLKKSQERLLAKRGAYQPASNLDITPVTPSAYTASAITPNGGNNWAVALTRTVAVSGFGQYVISFNSVTGFTCNNANCSQDLLP